MNSRLFVIMASCAVALPAFATSGFTSDNGELGGSYHPMPSGKTREQVKAELSAWQRNPITSAGWRQIDGDLGWVFVGTGAGKTRAEVAQELADSRRNPVSTDGWAFVGGEAGWMFVGTGRGSISTHTHASRK